MQAIRTISPFQLRPSNAQSMALQSKTMASPPKRRDPEHHFGVYKPLAERLSYGARVLANGQVKFKLDAPKASQVLVEIRSKDQIDGQMADYRLQKNPEGPTSGSRVVPMQRARNGDFQVTLPSIKSGDVYRYWLRYRQSPASAILHHQPAVWLEPKADPRADSMPFDVFGWSEVVDHKKYDWKHSESWQNHPNRYANRLGEKAFGLPKDTKIAELHLGLLGGYQGAMKEIDRLAEQGIFDAVEFLPLGEFFGAKNWGYDEIFKFAPESSYGRPDDLKRLVDHAHSKGINVLFDVVPNHFGHDGDIIDDFGPAYEKDSHHEWGSHLNFNDPNPQKRAFIRNYMMDMVLHWADRYQVDGFRLDDCKAVGSDDFLKELALTVKSYPETRDLVLVAEDNRFEAKTATPLTPLEQAEFKVQAQAPDYRPVQLANLGMNANWGFDFAYQVQASTTGINVYGHHADNIQGLANSINRGFDYKSNFGFRHSDNRLEPDQFDSFKNAYQAYYPHLSRHDMPQPQPQNLVAYTMSHDSNKELAGSRLIVQTLANELGLINPKTDYTRTYHLSKKDLEPFQAALAMVKAYSDEKAEGYKNEIRAALYPDLSPTERSDQEIPRYVVLQKLRSAFITQPELEPPHKKLRRVGLPENLTLDHLDEALTAYQNLKGYWEDQSKVWIDQPDRELFIDFEQAYQRAQAKNKIALAALFSYPGPQMAFMGDLEGDMHPFRFFAEEKPHDPEFGERLSHQMGYDPTHPSSFEEAKAEFPAYQDAYQQRVTQTWSKALNNFSKAHPVMQQGDPSHVDSYVYQQGGKPAPVFQVWREDPENGEELLILFNLSNEALGKDFELRGISNGTDWTLALSSDDSQYGGYKVDSSTPEESKTMNGRLNNKLQANSVAFFTRPTKNA